MIRIPERYLTHNCFALAAILLFTAPANAGDLADRYGFSLSASPLLIVARQPWMDAPYEVKQRAITNRRLQHRADAA